MRPRFLIWYTLLLVLPSLLIAAMAARWLRHEEQRLDSLARAAVAERAEVQAGGLDLLLRETAGALLDSLAQLPGDPTALRQWLGAQPFARHLFLWSPDTGLLLPDPDWSTPTETAFARRYEALFSGRQPWPFQQGTEEPAATALPSPQRALSYVRQEIARAGRSTPQPAASPAPLVQADESPAPVQTAMLAATAPADLPSTPAGTGWLPWFWERDLHLLGWIRFDDGGVRGVELETLAVLARFQTIFAEDSPEGTAFALLDHHGNPVMQSTSYEALSQQVEPVSVAVSPLLPNWQLRAALPPPSVAGHTPVLLAALLTGIFLVAILSGGALLGWQGYRHYRDAARKTSFVSNVSHELKTPLTTIRMYAEMLREGRIREESKRTGYLAVIVAESQRLTRLVNNVLDFSRLEQGRKNYRADSIDLANLVRDVVATQEERLREAGLQPAIAVPGATSLVVDSDRDALEQALLNLLDNAAKYAAGSGPLDITLSADVEGLHIVVADRGPGVPPAHAERIFESFHRVDDSLTARHPGSGLGLSIGRRLMRDLGGDLAYRARPGGGALFTLHIPRKVPHA